MLFWENWQVHWVIQMTLTFQGKPPESQGPSFSGAGITCRLK